MSMKKLELCFATMGVLVLIIAMMISVTPINAQLAGANLSGVVSDESPAEFVAEDRLKDQGEDQLMPQF